MSEDLRAPIGLEISWSAVDVHIGSRIGLRRTSIGMSTGRLATILGLTTPQVRKYEYGINRVTASRLFEISRVLHVPISFFFDDMPAGMDATPNSRRRGRMSADAEAPKPYSTNDSDILAKQETLELVIAYYKITDPAVRKRIFNLIKRLPPNPPSQGLSRFINMEGGAPTGARPSHLSSV